MPYERLQMSETVYTVQRQSNREVYHTDTTCYNRQRISNELELTKEKAERLGLSECKHCAGIIHREKNHDWSYQEALRNAGD